MFITCLQSVDYLISWFKIKLDID